MLLLVAFLVVFFFWLFLVVAANISNQSVMHRDEAILAMLRLPGNVRTPLGPAWLTEAMTDLTALGGGTVILLGILAVVGYMLLERQYRALAFLLVAVVGGLALDAGLKQFFGRERPPAEFHLVNASSPSFPSGHSMMSAVVYLTLAALVARTRPRWRTRIYIMGIAMLLSFLIGLSRVYLGVHYPTDVIGGWSAGLAWALLCSLGEAFLEQKLRRRNPP